MKIFTMLAIYSPFSDETTLRNIITGVDECQHENQLIFSYSHKCSTNAFPWHLQVPLKLLQIRQLIHDCCFRDSCLYHNLES